MAQAVVELEASYVQLRAVLGDLKLHFLNNHLRIKKVDGNDVISDIEIDLSVFDTIEKQTQLDLRAYCVLSHAAVEEFFEKVALIVIDEAMERWSKNSVSLPLLALALYHGEKVPAKGREDRLTFMRTSMAQLNRHYRGTIERNHGAHLDYLISIFNPIGVEIPNDAVRLTSLESFAALRGESAHKGMTAQRISSASSIYNGVQDILVLCEGVKEAAKQAIV